MGLARLARVLAGGREGLLVALPVALAGLPGPSWHKALWVAHAPKAQPQGGGGLPGARALGSAQNREHLPGLNAALADTHERPNKRADHLVAKGVRLDRKDPELASCGKP